MHDTHVHLELFLERLEKIKNLDRKTETCDPDFDQSYLENSLKNHDFAIQATISTKNFLLTHKLFSDIKNVHFLIGTQPEIINDEFDSNLYLEEQKELLENFFQTSYNQLQSLPFSQKQDLFKSKKVLGFGEIGLDYSYSEDKEIRHIQRVLFEAQIALSLDLELPFQIHTREAWHDTFAILKNFENKLNDKFIIHCFTGGVYELEKTLELGGSVAYGGVTTFKNGVEIQKTVSNCPKDRFVLETDLPFLAPTPHRGKICLPEYIENVAEKVAKLKNTTEHEIWKLSKQNTNRIFRTDF